MPSILMLEGPRLGAIRTPRSGTLLGVTDTIKAHPLMILAGLALGGWLAHKHISPWGAIWGEHQASHARTKSLTGRGGLRGPGCVETIKTFRNHKGKLVKFTTRTGDDCPKRPRPSAAHLRPYQFKAKR
jgi:hypothetical protein